jgi:fucose 4-O-acetylase-like acetyltransferase
MIMSERELHIETIRGIACLALVSMHVVGYTSESGLELPQSDWLFGLQVVFADMRMPLFSFISGMVFVAVPKADQNWNSLVLKKMRRLLIPMISVGTLFWIVRAGMGYEQPSLLRAYLFPFEHFWFLQATFILMFVSLMSNRLMLWFWPRSSYNGEAAVLIGVFGALAYVLGWGSTWVLFSVKHALFLALFFMAGQIAALKKDMLFHFLSWVGSGRLWLGLLGLIAMGGALAFEYITPSDSLRRIMSMGIGLGACLVLLGLRPQNRFLAEIGGKSYAIYLFHVFFTAGVTESLSYIAPDWDRHLFYFPALIAGILGPTIAQYVILQSAWTRWLFLGLRFPRPVFVSV